MVELAGGRWRREATAIRLPDGTEEITEVRFYVDDPRTFVSRARERLTARLPEEQAAGRL
jgi:hypothetical protein